MSVLLGLGALGVGLGALGSLGSSIGLGIAGNAAQGEMNNRQLAEAQRQFDANLEWQREQLRLQHKWYTEMSNTAHQREVADLLAAGLNPILTATGGSGASSATMPSPTPLSQNVPSALDPSVSLSAMQRGIADSVDMLSSTGLRYAQASEALSKAAQNDQLTDAMQQKILKEASAASSLSTKLTAEADQVQKLSEPKKAYLEGMTKYFKHRQWHDWFSFGASTARDLSREIRFWSGRGFDFGAGGFQRGFPELPRSQFPVQFQDNL